MVQDGEFVPLEQTAMIKDGRKKPRAVRVTKQLASGKTLSFNVMDQPPDAKSTKWELVVAVICSGKQWQFKQGFPFEVCRRPCSAGMYCCLAIITHRCRWDPCPAALGFEEKLVAHLVTLAYRG